MRWGVMGMRTRGRVGRRVMERGMRMTGGVVMRVVVGEVMVTPANRHAPALHHADAPPAPNPHPLRRA